MHKQTARGPSQEMLNRRINRWRWKSGLMPWAFLAAPLAVYMAMFAYPLVYSTILSFTKWAGMGPPPVLVGFANYQYLFSRGSLVLALRNNLIWLAICVPIPVVVGFLLALFLSERTKLNVILRSVFYMPMILSAAVMSVMWVSVYEPSHGLLTEMLKVLHVPVPGGSFLTGSGTAIVAIALVRVWHWIGFPMIMYLAAIQDIPKDLLESAELDGATRFQKMRYIVIPLVRHATIIIVTLGTILSMKVFDLVYLMTGGYYKNDVMGTLLWRYAFDQYRIGRASAVAVIEFGVIAVIVIPYLFWQNKNKQVEI